MNNIGIQMYSLRTVDLPFKEKLKAVSEMGYKKIEFNGYGDLTVLEIKNYLNEFKLTAGGIHASFDGNVDKEIEFAEILGIKYYICPVSDIKTEDDCKKRAEFFTEFFEKYKNSGLIFGVHNHWVEFEKTNGIYLMDTLLENTPKNFILEFDICWAARAGVDYISYIEKWKERIKIIHLKDLAKDRINVTKFGNGIIDFKSVINICRKTEITEFYIEQDEFINNSPLESMKHNFDYFSKLIK